MYLYANLKKYGLYNYLLNLKKTSSEKTYL